MKRIDWDTYYLNIARECSKRGTCLQRNYGAVIVNKGQIISTGYTGAARGRKNCSDIGKCIRREKGIPRGTRYELCRSVHAEMNAIIHASRNDMIGSTMYVHGIDVETDKVVKDAKPCRLCKALIINAGIETVQVQTDEKKYSTYDVKDWVEEDETLNIDPSDEGY